MLALVVLVCIVGFTEELMFRGVGLVTFRRMHLTEGQVALYSSLIFGAVHLSNALATGPSGIVQAIVVSFTGYMLYLTRRWADTIWLAMPVHASQDFVILSGQVGVDAEASPLAIVLFPTMLGLRDPALAQASPDRHRTLPSRPAESPMIVDASARPT